MFVQNLLQTTLQTYLQKIIEDLSCKCFTMISNMFTMSLPDHM